MLSSLVTYPGGNLGANLKSISHRCRPILVAFVWELTEETINLPLGCLQGGHERPFKGYLMCGLGAICIFFCWVFIDNS